MPANRGKRRKTCKNPQKMRLADTLSHNWGRCRAKASRLHKWTVRKMTRPRFVLVAYVVAVGFAGTVLLLATEKKNKHHLRFIDALFVSYSAVTSSGLSTVAMSDLTDFQLFVIMMLCLLGGKVFTALIDAFDRLRTATIAEKAKLNDAGSAAVAVEMQTIKPVAEAPPKKSVDALPPVPGDAAARNSVSSIGSVSFRSANKVFPESKEDGAVVFNAAAAEGTKRNMVMRAYRSDGDVLAVIRLRNKRLFSTGHGGLATIFQNHVQNDQKDDNKFALVQKEEGDIKESTVYRSLAWTLFAYQAGLQFAAAVLSRIYVAGSKSAQRALKERDTDATFWAVFMTISHFANAGFSPINDSMTPFTSNSLLLFIFIGQMLLGNTFFPSALRLAISVMAKLKDPDRGGSTWRRLLRAPRRYCTFLFPRGPSLWFMVVTAGCVSLQSVVIWSIMWDNEVMDGLTVWEKLLTTVFQTISTRHTGVNIWNVAVWSPTVLYLFIIIMYVPSPCVYEPGTALTEIEANKVTVQAKKMFFSTYSLFLATAALLISLAENNNVNTDPNNYSMLNIIFEVVSGGMNVGLSIGYTCSLRKVGADTCVDVPYSFCGKWSPLSKFILIIVMFVGRVR